MNFLTLALLASVITLASPDSRLSARIETDQQLSYSLTFAGETVVTSSNISMSLSNGEVWGRGKVKRVSRSSSDSMIPSPYYRKSEVRDHYNAVVVQYAGCSVEFRAYDDSFAWRFIGGKHKPYQVLSEQASFGFAEDFPMYASYTHTRAGGLDAQFADNFENVYKHTPLSGWETDHMAHLPLMVECGGGVKAVITESDLVSYPGMFLYTAGGKSLEGRFAPVPDSLVVGGHNGLQELVASRKDYIAECDGSARSFPWRIICLSTEDARMADNDAVWRLAAGPDPDTDYTWVKPGKVAWDWLNNWNVRGVDFVAGINTETYKYYIDFASRNNIEYILLDEGWAVLGANDLFNVVPEIDLPEIISYAESRNVGVFLWAGHYPFSCDMEKICSHYAEMGIKGFKVDFMERDDQLVEDFLTLSAQTCAKYHLMLDFHGIHKPVGLQRRFPNIVNQEGIFGLEQLRKKGLPEYDMVKFDVTAPFVRFVAGYADYTQGAMRNASKDNYRPVRTEVMSQGTRCRQLAMYVVFDSPLNMLCDSPTDYEMEKDCLAFMSAVPTVWDETRVLDGKVGEYIITARRKGDVWYVGAMTDWDERDVEIDLSGLTGGRWQADCWFDGLVAHKFARDFRRRTVSGDSKLSVHLAPGGGFAAIVR